jgi:predicted site-specific integrase-resolvase
MTPRNLHIAHSITDPKDPPTHVSTVAAAQQLTVSPRTVLSWIKAGHLLAAKLPNGRYVVPITEIDRLTTVGGDR